jgi:hypothetical protein
MAKAQAQENTGSLELTITGARLSHPHLFEATAYKPGQDKNYSCEFLLNKETTDIKAIQAPLIAAMKKKFGADKSQWPNPYKSPNKDGDKPKMNKKTKKLEVRDEHKGHWIVRASTKEKYGAPHVVSRNPDVPLTSAAEIYPGCFVRGMVKAVAYGEVGEEIVGVKFALQGVQFMKHGEAIGGKKPANQMFDMIEDDEVAEENFDAPNENFDEDEMTF